MPFVKDDVSVTQVSATNWKLLEPVIYEGNHDTFKIPRGFVTDFASVPRIFFWLVPTYGIYTKAAILHDYLVRRSVIPVTDADGIFRRALRELTVPFYRRWLMWTAVRLHSGLEGISAGDFIRWLLVFVPSSALLVIPAIVILVWLVIIWLIEVAFYFILKPTSRKKVNPPRFLS
jgi:hypothetical protein